MFSLRCGVALCVCGVAWVMLGSGVEAAAVSGHGRTDIAGLSALADDIGGAADAAGRRVVQDAQHVIDWWKERRGNWSVRVAVVGVLVGLVSCFLGYRLFPVLLCVAGAGLGGSVAFLAVEAAIPGARTASIVGAIIGALLGAGIAFVAYYVGVFLAGAAAATALALMVKMHVAPESSQLILLAPAVLGGVVALFLKRPLLILATALAGAWQAAVGLLTLLGRGTELANPQLVRVAIQDPETFRAVLSAEWLLLPVWAVLLLLGAVVQFRTTRRHDHPAGA